MDDQETAPRAHRAGGREAKRAARLARAATSVPYITRKIGIYEVLDEEGLALIERNADTILAEIGIDYRDDPRRSRSGRPRARTSMACACAARRACAAASS
jgi:trimethylamine--corrinoid protein Co-methyltransferase